MKRKMRVPNVYYCLMDGRAIEGGFDAATVLSTADTLEEAKEDLIVFPLDTSIWKVKRGVAAEMVYPR